MPQKHAALVAVVLLLLSLSGCLTKKCDPPYIRQRGYCCLDNNKNNVCDETEAAKPSCADGTLNQGEEGVDCGGPCRACTSRCTTECIDDDECTVDVCNADTNYTCEHNKVISVACQTKCPPSCDDESVCTVDLCSDKTGYSCIHKPIKPCCGDGLCEDTPQKKDCPEDCPLIAAEPETGTPTPEGETGYGTIPVTVAVEFRADVEGVYARLGCVENVGNCTNLLVYPASKFEKKDMYLADSERLLVNGHMATGQTKTARIRKMSRSSEANLSLRLIPKTEYFYRLENGAWLPRRWGNMTCNLNITSTKPHHVIQHTFNVTLEGGCENHLRDQDEVEVDCGRQCKKCTCLDDTHCGADRYISKSYCAKGATVRDKLVHECVRTLWESPFCVSKVIQEPIKGYCFEETVGKGIREI